MKFSVAVEKDEDGYYVASVPELPGCQRAQTDPAWVIQFDMI